MSSPGKIRLATRGSRLALWQTESVCDIIHALAPDLEIEIIKVSTSADRHADRPLHEFGDKGLFVKEIEQTLLDGRADAGVHSLKDLPGEIASGLRIAAVLKRADARDALLSRTGQTLRELAPGSVVATSSLRRRGQICRVRPDIRVCDVRGNVDTRIAKLDRGDFDAIVLAAAGLERMGFGNRICELFDVDTLIPAPGQGAIAIEAPDDSVFGEVWRRIDDDRTRICVETEREFTRILGANCRTPAGCYCHFRSEELNLIAMVCSANGSEYLHTAQSGAPKDRLLLARNAAEDLLAKGAAHLLG